MVTIDSVRKSVVAFVASDVGKTWIVVVEGAGVSGSAQARIVIRALPTSIPVRSAFTSDGPCGENIMHVEHTLEAPGIVDDQEDGDLGVFHLRQGGDGQLI